MRYRIELYRRRTCKVNSNIAAFSDVWRDGRPVDFYIALEFCDDDIEIARERISEAAFRRAVVAEADCRGLGNMPLQCRPEPARQFACVREILDNAESARTERRWTSDETQRLIQLVRKYGQNWEDIAKQMKGRTPAECSAHSRKLQQQTKNTHSPVDSDAVLSVTFVHDGIRYRVPSG
jgi:hypothetical protein